jgi:chromosome segregation ATPase
MDAEAESRLRADHSEEIAALQRQLTVARNKAERLEEERAAAVKAAEAAKAEAADARQREQAAVEAAAAEAEANAQQAAAGGGGSAAETALRGQVAELTVKLATARKDLEKARTEVKSLKDAQGLSSDRQRAKLAAELAAVETKWRTAATALKEKKSALDATVAAAQEDMQEWEQQRDELHVALTAAQAEAEDWRTRCESTAHWHGSRFRR